MGDHRVEHLMGFSDHIPDRGHRAQTPAKESFEGKLASAVQAAAGIEVFLGMRAAP